MFGRKAGHAGSRFLAKFLLCTTLVTAAACTTATFVIQQYDGEALPAERVAILRIQGGEEAIIAELDGEVLDYRIAERTDRVHIELLPGNHEIGIAQHPFGRVAYLAFDAQAGRSYQAFIIHNPLARGLQATWRAAVYEIDSDSGEQLQDVSIQESPTAPVPAPSPLPPEPQETEPTTAPAAAGPSALPAPSTSSPPASSGTGVATDDAPSGQPQNPPAPPQPPSPSPTTPPSPTAPPQPAPTPPSAPTQPPPPNPPAATDGSVTTPNSPAVSPSSDAAPK